jgi:hypothetical protein
MLKTILLAFGLSFLCGAIPAVASWADFCRANRCAHGSQNPERCMHNCVAFCQEKHSKGGQK